MARRTKFQPGDLVRVRYGTRQMDETFFCKIVEYIPEVRMYTLGILAIPAYPNKVLAVPYQRAILSAAKDITLVTAAELTALKELTYLNLALLYMKPKMRWHPESDMKHLSRTLAHALKVTKHIPDTQDLTAVDVSGYGVMSRRRWFDANPRTYS